MDIRRLHAFVKIVDIGSLTRAAAVLHVAQPALSQQVLGLETHFNEQLLIRSKNGVAPTDAGRKLYRHAQIILRQLEQAEIDISVEADVLAGRVSVGLAPLSSASSLALLLLQAVRKRYPNIVLVIHENIGGVISEQIMKGKMDIAFIYDPGDVRGVDVTPLLHEDMFLVAHKSVLSPELQQSETASVKSVSELNLVLPTPIHVVRQIVDTTFRRVGVEGKVIAEVEYVPTIASAIWSGLGATILPLSAAEALLKDQEDIVKLKITNPSIQAKLSLCTSDQIPLSQPAIAVANILTKLAHEFAENHENCGIQRIENA